jgi:hypothetical protein
VNIIIWSPLFVINNIFKRNIPGNAVDFFLCVEIPTVSGILSMKKSKGKTVLNGSAQSNSSLCFSFSLPKWWQGLR